jgi:hypothetical protein
VNRFEQRSEIGCDAIMLGIGRAHGCLGTGEERGRI